MIDKRTIEQNILHGTATLLDVRRQDEWDEGHVPGALHYDSARIEKGEIPDLPRDRVIYTYCRSGGRATRVAQILQEQGFQNVVCIGGYDDWKHIG